jgi:hypothetical protein
MSHELPPDTELYRQQLEARARIFYSTSEIWLRVRAEADEQWVADLHQRGGADHNGAAGLEPYPRHPGGFSSSAQGALEEFARELDERELALDAERVG